ncbi:hypothetical protein DYJ25_07375 [Prevotella denticola]|nr:hypothetical protein DYJ25_07375 [Prevotella denticola]
MFIVDKKVAEIPEKEVSTVLSCLFYLYWNPIILGYYATLGLDGKNSRLYHGFFGSILIMPYEDLLFIFQIVVFVKTTSLVLPKYGMIN